jgi:hypothetical protein
MFMWDNNGGVMRYVPLVLLALLAGCGDATAPEQPANVRIEWIDAAQSLFGEWHVPMTLKNAGGPGGFKLRFWVQPPGPGSTEYVCSESDALDVPAQWRETVTWVFGCERRPHRVEVLTRQPNSVVFEVTQRQTIPPP